MTALDQIKIIELEDIGSGPVKAAVLEFKRVSPYYAPVSSDELKQQVVRDVKDWLSKL